MLCTKALAVYVSRTEASGVGDIRNLTHEDSIAKDSTASSHLSFLEGIILDTIGNILPGVA